MSKVMLRTFASQTPSDSTKFWNRNRVGPKTRTVTSRTPAIVRLMFDSHLIPAPTPETTEAVASRVMMTMRMMRKVLS